MAFKRIVWVVLDSVGIGALPDADEYGDVGRNTLGHIAESRPLAMPNLVRLGLANIAPLAHLTPAQGARWLLRQRRHALAGQGHDDGPLGDGRHLAAAGVSRLPARLSAGSDRGIRARHRPQDDRQQARQRHGNSQGTGRGAHAHGLPDRLHLGRQRFPDRRARRGDSRRRALPLCARSRERCWTGRIAWAA